MATKRGQKWQAAVRWKGDYHRPTFDTEHEAVAWEQAAREARKTGGPLPPLPEQTKAGGEHTLHGFAEEHFEFLWGDSKAREATANTMKQALSHFEKDVLVKDIRHSKLTTLVKECREKGNSNKTINRKLSIISKLLRHALNLEIIQDVPTIPRQKESKGRISYLDKDTEYLRVIAWFKINDDELYAQLVTFLCHTGLRPGHSELDDLQWSDIKGGSIHLRKGKTGGRTVPLSQSAAEALAWIKSKGYSKPFPIYYRTFGEHWNAMRDALGKSGDPDFTPYIMRHTCASWLAIAGVDSLRIMHWMGHTSLNTTKNYMHLAPDHLDSCAAALG